MRSTTDRRRPLLFAIALGLALAALPALPCGPYFPVSLLGDSGEMAKLPEDPFATEVRALASLPVPRFPAVASGRPARATAEVGQNQLVAALGLDPAAAGDDPLVRRYAAVRGAIRDHLESVEAWRQEVAWWGREAAAPRPEMPTVAVPDGLPPEIAFYLEGAVAWHRDDLPAARRAWEALLDLPPAERRLRSVWAEYMLGRLELEAAEATLEGSAADGAAGARGRLSAAAGHLCRARELAGDGYPDPLGLAGESLGWEARAAWRAGRWAEAFELYGEQLAAGDAGAGGSLHRVARLALEEGDAALDDLATSPFARDAMGVYLAGHLELRSPDGAAVAAAEAWADRLQAHGVSETESAGLIAWVAYQSGDFGAADRWAALGTSDDRRSRWVRYKLLLRAGRLDQAAATLARLEPGSAPARVSGEAGAVEVGRGRYAEALDRLLRAGWWLDAVYVADRLLTLDELTAYVDEGWPSPAASDPEWYPASAQPPPDDWIRGEVRHLLARRLARAGRWRDALPYYPDGAVARAARMVVDWQECYDDPACPRARRAEALWLAALTLRFQGMELVATGLGPDYAIWAGDFEYGFTAPERARHEVLPADAVELDRWRRTAPSDPRRWHHRYVAADLAWRAAELMPDQHPDTAGVLATAGSWIEVRDPAAALRFYQALVGRCGDTALGREARRRHWFPPL